MKKSKVALKARTTIQSDTPAALLAANDKHQVAAALAPDPGHHQHDREHTHGPRGPPPAVRLMSKHEVLAVVGCSYPTLWAWMRAGTFPRGRVVGGKSMWLSTEIDAWLENCRCVASRAIPRRSLSR